MGRLHSSHLYVVVFSPSPACYCRLSSLAGLDGQLHSFQERLGSVILLDNQVCESDANVGEDGVELYCQQQRDLWPTVHKIAHG